MRVGPYFVLALLASGLVFGALAGFYPSFAALPIPVFIWPLFVALIIDLALMPLVRDGRVVPVTMNQRAFGVIGAGLLVIALSAYLSGRVSPA